MIGLLFPTAGTVTVGTHNLATLNEEKLREIRISIGMLFQGAALFDSLSVYENIAFPLKEYGRVPDAEITSIVEEKLSLVDLPETIYKFPPSLSGGQKKRVGLARAMATNPKVLLFDEPTTGLDPTSRDKIDRLIMQLRDKYGITSVVVTHDMESARRISDRLILVHNGIVIAEGQAVSLWGKNHAVDYFATGRWDEYIRETA
jgi:phospholipid/cholesterol/gamma-HCH transport system ATP-binding protein